MPKMTQVT